MLFRTYVSYAEGQETYVRTDMKIRGSTTVVQLSKTYRSKFFGLKEIIHDIQHQSVADIQHSSQKHNPCNQRITEHESVFDFTVIHSSNILGICGIPIEIEQFPSEFLHRSCV